VTVARDRKCRCSCHRSRLFGTGTVAARRTPVVSISNQPDPGRQGEEVLQPAQPVDPVVLPVRIERTGKKKKKRKIREKRRTSDQRILLGMVMVWYSLMPARGRRGAHRLSYSAACSIRLVPAVGGDRRRARCGMPSRLRDGSSCASIVSSLSSMWPTVREHPLSSTTSISAGVPCRRGATWLCL